MYVIQPIFATESDKISRYTLSLFKNGRYQHVTTHEKLGRIRKVCARLGIKPMELEPGEPLPF